MSAKKIEELFRSKLEGHSVPPGEQAWMKLQGKMAKRNKTPLVWMRVAAAVLLVLTATWLLTTPGGEQATVEQVADNRPEIDTPVPATDDTEKVKQPVEEPDASQKALAENTTKEKPRQAPPATRKRAGQPKQPVQLAENATTAAATPMPMEQIELAQLDPEKMNLPEEVSPAEMETAIARVSEIKPPAQEVKITYIAGEEESFLQPVRELIASDTAKEPKERKGFGKLIASAKNIAAADLLADIRDTKDELFRGNLKIGKEEKLNNSK